MAASFGLREKKYAKTKIALARAFIARLQSCRLDDVVIAEVCAQADVSPGTFFNYFPHKIDVVHYFNQLVSVKVLWSALRRSPRGAVLAQIDTVFALLNEEYRNPNVVYEMISAVVGQKQSPMVIGITAAEKYYAFPDCDGIEQIPHDTIMFDGFFEKCLQAAIAAKELPKTTNIAAALLALRTILVGLPLAVRFEHFAEIGTHYRAQLHFLWLALGRKKVAKQ